MEFKVNDISLSEKEVEVTLSYDEIRSEIEGEVKKESSKIQVPGFRKGKVPKQIIKQRFGDTLEFEASEKVANSRFWQLAKENNFRPIGQPVMTDLDFNIEKDFKFKVKYEVLPEIDVKDYTGQLIEVPDLNVKPEDVEKEIDNLLRSNSSQEEADAIGDDDNFLLDVELTRTDDSGQPVADSKPENVAPAAFQISNVTRAFRRPPAGNRFPLAFPCAFLETDFNSGAFSARSSGGKV